MSETSLFWSDGTGDGGPYSQDQLRLFANVLGLANAANIGIIPSQLNLLAPTSTGINNITADTGYAIVDGTLYENDASKGLTVASPSSDTTGVRLSLRKDWTAQTVRLTATKNTDGNSAIPSLTQVDGTTWDIPIATFTITTGGDIGALTDVREFTREATINIVISGDGSVIATGIVEGDIELPFAMHPIGWTVLGDQSGSIVLDIWLDEYNTYPPTVADTVTASDKPTISGATKGQNLRASTWTGTWAKGSTLRVKVDSVATLTYCTLALRVALL